jgi:hypothetical protein
MEKKQIIFPERQRQKNQESTIASWILTPQKIQVFIEVQVSTWREK